jgi:pectate lyase
MWGYPDASNTGPTGLLEKSTGNITVSRPGTVIKNRKINGCIKIRANNVTVRNTEIHCSIVRDGGYGISNLNGNTGLVIEDVLIECGHDVGDGAVTLENFTIRRSEMFGCENIIWAERNVVIEDSYIHDPISSRTPGSPHTDSIQIPAGASNIRIDHNTILGGYENRSAFGNAAITASASPGTGVTNVLVNNNLFAGGGYTLYCPGNDGGFTWTNNRFSRRFVKTVGGFGPIYRTCAQHTNSGNVYHETGAPLNLG